ncbi:MAG: GntR family transcriptional regulator [Oscillospiraceae bacterium]|nr:GntR family transcriptional regulator [Oscillospiraceae bacterium]
MKRKFEFDILSGKYLAGKRVPTILQFKGLYNVGESTAYKVLDSLVDDGILIKKHGVGYFLKPYITDKLMQSHVIDIKKQINEAINHARHIGLKNEDILDLFIETLNLN